MVIDLYITGSEKNAIYKNLQNELELTGNLRNESSVITPVFTIQHPNPTSYNYCFIPDFNRYYFITNIESVRTNLWRIHCNVDVLMSYQAQILNLSVIVSKNTSPDTENYFNGDVWKSTVRTKTDVLSFPSGLLDNGEYILITSGGVAS